MDKIFVKFKTLEVSLFIRKYHFIHSNIKLHGHFILYLRYTIKNKKIEAIRNKIFIIVLKELKTDVSFFNYYYKCIEKFAIIIKLILRLKIIRFQTYPIKNRL